MTGIGERTIRRYAETPQWHHALDVFGYTGQRTFSLQPNRDTQRDNGEVFEKAREVYLEALQASEPKHKLATITGNAVELSRRRIHV